MLDTIAIMPDGAKLSLTMFHSVATQFLEHCLQTRTCGTHHFMSRQKGWTIVQDPMDRSFYDFFQKVQTSSKYAFQSQHQVWQKVLKLLPKVREVRKIVTERAANTRNAEKWEAELFPKSLAFLHRTHTTITAKMLAERIAGGKLPQELIDAVRDEIFVAFHNENEA